MGQRELLQGSAGYRRQGKQPRLRRVARLYVLLSVVRETELTAGGTGRNQGYLDLAINFTLSVVKDRAIINMFPELLKP